MSKLFQPITIGSIEAKNRVFMSPLTRGRATREAIPTPLMAEYYAQRASSGLIISEATGISREGLGWPYAPGIWSQEQVEAWKPITEAVHAKGGKIVLQLWHMGRVVHSSVSGLQPVSASATSIGEDLHTYEGKQPAEVARELTKDDIKRVAREFGVAAKNAIAAGFDGVQIHGANGYLVDQFLRSSTNHRTDEYGGSVENRVRFLDNVVSAVVAAVGGARTSVRFSPNGYSQGVGDEEAEAVFEAACKVLNKHGVAWAELRQSSPDSLMMPTDQPKQDGLFRKHFKGQLVLNQEYTKETAEEAVDSGAADAIAFGRAYITNPDLVDKLREGLPLRVESNMARWYSHGREGYVDY